MKLRIFIIVLLLHSNTFGQKKQYIETGGEKLKAFYLSLDVEKYWLSGHHVIWDTGAPDMPESIHGNKTHCSAFAAAACKKAGVYLLCPPEHVQILLANAQYDWLSGPDGKKAGWERLEGMERYGAAQREANRGYIVVAVYQNTDHSLPGHIALIMPADRTAKRIEAKGPELIMAGTHNHNYISLRNGFARHINSWPENEIMFYKQTRLPAI